MDINNITGEDTMAYRRHYLWGMHTEDSKYNTFPESTTMPEETPHPCMCDESKTHWGCCACGCGGVTYSTYVAGHDQKHYGKLIREYAAEVTNAGRARIIKSAERWASDGVYNKLLHKFSIKKVRGNGIGLYHYIFNNISMVTKVGRWYYPVIVDLVGTPLRSTKTVQDQFDGNHDFTVVTKYEDITTLYDLLTTQQKAKEEAAA